MAGSRPGRPATPLDDKLREFANAYIRTRVLRRAIREVYGENSKEYRSPTSVLKRARKYGLIPDNPVSGQHADLLAEARLADALAADTAPTPPKFAADLIELEKRVSIKKAPPPGPGVQRAPFMQMPKQELLARLSFMGRASITPFVGMDFVPDTPGEAAPEPEAEEFEGVRGRWVYGLSMSTIGRALRAGYGSWIRELKFDQQGRPCIKLHNAPDVMQVLAKICGYEKVEDRKMTVEVLMNTTALPPEQQRQRALAALSAPARNRIEESIEDAEVIDAVAAAASTGSPED